MLHKPKLRHTLVTFKICPWCMRVLTMMHQKGIEMEVMFIEFSNRPEWFDQVSPLGQVPILMIGDRGEVIIFESNVILEYLDEMVKPSLMSTDPIERAVDRARFEFSNEMIKTIHQFAFATECDKFIHAKEKLCKYFARLESWLGDGKYFHGNEISLIDIVYVPVFVILTILQKVMQCDFVKKYPKMVEYSNALFALPSVKKGRVPDYEQLLLDGLRKQGTFLFKNNAHLFKQCQ